MRKLFRLPLTRMNYVLTIVVMALLGYSVVAGYLYVFQRKLLYIPNRNLGSPGTYQLYDMGALSLKTSDKTNIVAWYVPPPDDTAPVVVYFHGNAGNLSDRHEKFSRFLEYPIGFMALSYRGYGTSQGSPSEEGFYEDARTVINYLLNKGIEQKRIVLYGESLGSGVAVQMATEYVQVRALVLEAPYLSISQRAHELYPFIPVPWLLKDKFDSATKIKQIHCPLLIFHGEEDKTIPIRHGMELFEKATVPKEAHFFPHIGHTDFDLGKIVRLTMQFVESH